MEIDWIDSIVDKIGVQKLDHDTLNEYLDTLHTAFENPITDEKIRQRSYHLYQKIIKTARN